MILPEDMEPPILVSATEEKKDVPAKIKKPRKIKSQVVLPTSISTQARLYRFLYTGREDGKYAAGFWNTKLYYNEDFVPSVSEMVVDLKSAEKFVEAVKYVKAHVPRVEPCMFALALGVKATPSTEVKTLLYKEAHSIISSCDEFFLFIHHLSGLKTGTGAGWRRFVQTWYKAIPPKQLAAMVCEQNVDHCWAHKDIMKLSHGFNVPESNIGLMTIMCYIYKGLEEAKKTFGSEPLAQDVLSILQTTTQARKCTDGDLLATLITENQHLGYKFLTESNFSIKMVGPAWRVLLERIPIELVLKSVQRLHNDLLLVDYNNSCADSPPELAMMMKLLTEAKHQEQDVSSALIKVLNEAKEAPPILTYIIIRDYQSGRRRLAPIKLEHFKKAKATKLSICLSAKNSDKCLKRWEKQPRKGELLPPRKDVEEALLGLLQRSLVLKPEAERRPGRYLITVDMRVHMFKVFQECRKIDLENKLSEMRLEGYTMEGASKVYPNDKNQCFWSEHVSPGKAGILLTLYFLSRMQETTVAVFTPEGIETVTIENKDGVLSMDRAEEQLTSIKQGGMSLSKPIEWALAQKKPYDLFINVVRTAAKVNDLPKELRAEGANPHDVLYKYQTEMELPNAGLVNLSLGRFSRVRLDYNLRRILDIFGFDEHVPNVIHTFAEAAAEKL